MLAFADQYRIYSVKVYRHLPPRCNNRFSHPRAVPEANIDSLDYAAARWVSPRVLHLSAP